MMDEDTTDTHYLIVRARSSQDLVTARRAIHASGADVGDVVIRGDTDSYFRLFSIKPHRDRVARVYHHLMDTAKAEFKKTKDKT